MNENDWNNLRKQGEILEEKTHLYRALERCHRIEGNLYGQLHRTLVAQRARYGVENYYGSSQREGAQAQQKLIQSGLEAINVEITTLQAQLDTLSPVPEQA
jgi:hypothetical protein